MITRSRNLFIPEITGVILIDCWDFSDQDVPIKESVRCFYHDLIRDLKQHQVRTVINALTQTDVYKVDANIERELFKDRLVLHWHDPTSFEDYLRNHQDEPQEWYVAGQSWNMCVHDNGLGLKSLCQVLTQHSVNFYATDKSFLKLDGTTVGYQDFEQDQLRWQFLNWFGYQLQGE